MMKIYIFETCPVNSTVVAKATAEANKFRQTPQEHKQIAIFEDLTKHSIEVEPREMSNTDLAEYKSRIELGHSRKHKIKCCTLLKNKFKKFKRKRKERISIASEESVENDRIFHPSTENDKRKINFGDPEEENQRQINSMLHGI